MLVESSSIGSSFDLVRNCQDPLVIVYDVLGHFPQPRSHLSPALIKNFDLRSKNGLLFSQKNDLVICSCEMDKDHITWLRKNGFANGSIYLFNENQQDLEKSYFEKLVDSPDETLKISKLIQNNKMKFFSWMNSSAELNFIKKMDLKTAWNTPKNILNEQFNKQTFKKSINELGLPELPGFACSSLNEPINIIFFHENLSKINQNDFFVAKPANGAAGSGIFKFHILEYQEVADRLNNSKNIWIIENYIEDSVSLNIQLFIDCSGKKYCLGLSEQLFNGFMYQGNQSLMTNRLAQKVLDEVFNQSELLADSLFLKGYTGIIGLDFIIKNHEVYLIENNIRINGSTFSLLLINQIEQEVQEKVFWKFEKFKLDFPLSFFQLDRILKEFQFNVNRIKQVGFFTQEFNTSENSTELAATYWANSEDLLEQLKIEIEKRMRNGRNNYN